MKCPKCGIVWSIAATQPTIDDSIRQFTHCNKTWYVKNEIILNPVDKEISDGRVKASKKWKDYASSMHR